MNKLLIRLLTLSIISSFILHPSSSFPQGIPIGEWRDHLPNNSCISVSEIDSRIFAATSYGVFSFDKSDNSINRITKVNGLSDIGLSSIAYCQPLKTLIICYTNANIDLLRDGKITNLPDIKRKPILGNKTINRVVVIGDMAYLCCGFGIVVVDLEKYEIKDTYYLGPGGSALEVHDITTDGNRFYVATEKGLYSASVDNPNLANYSSWSVDNSLPYPTAKYNTVAYYDNKLFTNLSKEAYYSDTMFVRTGNSWDYFDRTNTATRYRLIAAGEKLLIVNVDVIEIKDNSLETKQLIYTYLLDGLNCTPAPRDALIDKENNCWIADLDQGLIKNYNTWGFDRVRPNGPLLNKVFDMAYSGGKVASVPGGRNLSWGNVWERAVLSSFSDDDWKSNDRVTDPVLDSVRDFITLAIDPMDSGHIYAGSWGFGLAEFYQGNLKTLFGESNSSLQAPPTYPEWNVIVGGLAFDGDGNLWVSNSSAPKLISVRKFPGGNWKSYDLGTLYPGATAIDAGEVLIDQNDQKWILLRGNKILVFNTNFTIDNTNDDKARIVTGGIGQGNLPGARVLSMACDKEGLVWVGTDEGVAVFYSPESIFSGYNFDAQRVYVTVGGYTQYLLESESVTCIAVDGANRKWFGTERAGVFLMSSDGTQQIQHFTEENSPLLSNQVSSITIDEQNGEVFFGTSNGIISYKGTATGGGESNQDVTVYPNPVRPGYEGSIAIKGLVNDADVKITDISGTLIFQTKALGGQAIWNGRNFDGKKASTGVYLIFISNEDGSQTYVSKIMFLN